MGLLGGFKAKLFSRNKEKPSGVVCLSYHINPDVYGTPGKSDYTTKTKNYFDKMTNLQHPLKQYRHKTLENMK